MIVDKINQYLNSEDKHLDEAVLEEAKKRLETVMKRQFMENRRGSEGRIYISSMGKKCARQLAYKYHGYKPEPVQPRTRNKWFIGDLTELGVLSVAKLAGVDIGLNNEPVELEINGVKERGYIDGLCYNGEKSYLIEVKSMTKWGFKNFEKHGPDNMWGYLTQINLYMKALELDQAILIAVTPDTGHMSERLVNFDPKYVQIAERNVEAVINSTKDELPPRFKNWEDLKWMSRNQCWELGTICSYCGFNLRCWPEVTCETVSGKPKFRIYRKDLEAKGLIDRGRVIA